MPIRSEGATQQTGLTPHDHIPQDSERIHLDPQQNRVCRIRYLSEGSASDVLLEATGLPGKLFPGHSLVVSDCVGGCDG